MAIRKVAVLSLFDAGDEITAVRSSYHVIGDGHEYIHIDAISGYCRLEEFEQWAEEVKSLFAKTPPESEDPRGAGG